jgi:hypothetical protein
MLTNFTLKCYGIARDIKMWVGMARNCICYGIAREEIHILYIKGKMYLFREFSSVDRDIAYYM